MKRFFIMMATCAMLASCHNTGKNASGNDEGNSTETGATVTDTLTYEGIVPAADGPGIRYTLAMTKDSTKGFHLKATYIEAENGKDKTFEYEGKAENITQADGGGTKNAIKLNLGENDAMYMLQVDDSTMRLVNKDLEESVTNLNYDLKLK